MRALRVPLEPVAVLRQIAPECASALRLIMDPWARLLAWRARRRGLLVPDHVFGLAFTGALTKVRLVALLQRLPPGISEIYSHPALENGFPFSVPGALYRDEFLALTAPEAKAAWQASGAQLGGFLS